MQELISQLVAKAGVTEQQAIQSIQTIKEFIQAKLPPMMHGVIDNFLGDSAPAADHAEPMAEAKEEDFMSKAKAAAGTAGDKIEDFAQTAGDKLEDMTKQAGDKLHDLAGKAGDMAEDAMNKLKDMFNGSDKK